MTAHIVYNGDLRTTATHVRSGTSIETDAPVDNKGKGERFSPTDLVAVALATCMVTTMGIAAPIHDLDLDGSECEVTKIMASDPRRIAEIVVVMSFPKSKPFTDKQRFKIEQIAHTCPVFISLHPDMKKSISFVWPE
ncbi:OsmC family protein [Nemorincola caseinilytica]|uniref:OsmC family protein n=1 Tax=Nemorincola caseinilytica TaxID=2054315 RepID=A0ABP8N5Q4_9BACT